MDRDTKGKFLNGHKSFREKKAKKCSVDTCNKGVLSMGYCGQHYQRLKKYGDALEPMHWTGRPTTKLKFYCLKCGDAFLRPPSAVKKNSIKYCSRECAFIGAVGKQKNVPPIEESTWRINRKGYLETTRRRKRILQHRWVMEKHLGRPLTNKEFVHHLNGIKTDNMIENLIVLDSGLHSREHRSTVKENNVLKQLLWNISQDLDGVEKNWVKNVKHFYYKKLLQK